MNRLASPAVIVTAFLAGAPLAGAQEILHPLQLLSGLHRIQDSIARGDRSALALQPDMITIVDESFRRDFSEKGGLDDQVRPLIIFALGGGGARPASRMLEHVPADHPDYPIAQAALAYIAGNAERSREIFAQIDIMKVGAPLAAYVALAKGTINISKDKEEALRDFNQARLLAPGTLIEEVALRRLLSVHLALDDPEGFSLTAQQYAHRYINSPFASQFVKLYVPGIVKLNDTVPHEKIVNLLAAMTQDQRIAILMRLARNAAVAGHLALSSFASAELSRDAAGANKISDARLQLYESLAQVTSPKAREALAKLSGINERDLPAEDRPLLQAALSLAGAVVGPAGENPSMIMRQPMPELMPEPVLASQATGIRLPEGKTAAEPQGDAEANGILDASVDSLLTSTREKLNSIDKLIDE